MTGPWFGNRESRQNRDDLAPARSALDAAAQALIDLDTRQGYVDDAIKAAGELGGTDELARSWTPVAERAFKASAEYLDATARYPLTDSVGRPNRGIDVETARRAFVGAHRSMADAAAAVDAFYSRHRDRIEAGKRALAVIPQQIDAARRAADAVTEQAAALGERDAKLLDLRSVTSAINELSAAMAQLTTGGPAPVQAQSAAAVQAAASALREALEDAPQLATRTRSSLPSVRTRLDSLATRMQRMPDALSAMWREFNQASSADLAQHPRAAEVALDSARHELGRAEAAVTAGAPESAQEAITAARAHAAEADRLIDEVTHRLEQLRSARADPRGAEHPVRFAIRDAQRLVVDRGLTAEWGTVLDAQSARVDRAVAALDRPHPDYWAMLTELKSVRDFVADIVDRVRRRARQDEGGT